MAAGTWMAWTMDFKSSTYVLHLFGVAVPCYAAVSALALNIAVGLVLSLAFNAAGGARVDETVAADYV